MRREADGTLTVGITDHAQEQLGDIVFVELPKVGRKVEGRARPCAVVESVKAASDIYAPVAGEVVAVNDALCRRAGAGERTTPTGLDVQHQARRSRRDRHACSMPRRTRRRASGLDADERIHARRRPFPMPSAPHARASSSITPRSRAATSAPTPDEQAAMLAALGFASRAR